MNTNQQLNLREIILRALKSKLKHSDYITLMLRENWEAICGSTLGKKTKPRSFSNDILTINADNPVLSFELRFNKDDLINKVNGYLLSLSKEETFEGKSLSVKDIKFIND